MKIGLHDFDKTGYPNLALMKLSQYHKAYGNKVEWVQNDGEYDQVYGSRVFTYSPDIFLDDKSFMEFNADEVFLGGSGFGLIARLSEEVEHTCPDYELYDLDYSLGFVTRGCYRSCDWCIVREKEGTIKPHTTVDEFL
ncbi:MAG: radical SAM protein, partial [Candidatus Thorarchaeota archaeon]|nr:radical SAM protein [Candidatus Thorarchaeota archaeon]NIW52874.1 radical SAM protein [Candidatus Korarchaeota archaeon]